MSYAATAALQSAVIRACATATALVLSATPSMTRCRWRRRRAPASLGPEDVRTGRHDGAGRANDFVVSGPVGHG